MNKLFRIEAVVRVRATFIILTAFCVTFCGLAQAGEELQQGAQYTTIRPIYIMGIYNSLNNRKLSKDTARAYLHPKQYYKKSEVAFQKEVPIGTIMTIVSSIPRTWYLPFSSKQYLVQLDPDLSRGFDVMLKLNRGVEGELDGLNSELFRRRK